MDTQNNKTVTDTEALTQIREVVGDPLKTMSNGQLITHIEYLVKVNERLVKYFDEFEEVIGKFKEI